MTTATATKNTTATVVDPKLETVIDAMRDVQTEGDRWKLAEALVVMLPKGSNGFGDIIDKATAEGVVGGLTPTTLRLYRDTAARWPADKRVAGVSFSAHREAMPLPSIDAGVKMLNGLSKTMGVGKVTASEVRKQVAIAQGKTPNVKASTPAAGSTRAVDVLRDLTDNGGAELIKVIGNESDADKLDKLDNGLKKVIAHVERLRAKAARKASASKAPPKASTPAAATEAKKPAARKAVGDMRDL